ncbi:LicD family protein [Polaribacter ponticola]|uniref:LicD family protein n=1 Tax=Polaribacter ponticola TaxID=2978475 RepID=A0ABT5S5L9_9FLAO|nr:LicD family protein [Polaribacter sp. MSW5]MDD7913385.1 LicD family protein [Polaribacter sp. MSW5]
MIKVEIKDIQNKLLEIIEYFDAFCKENSITYYLMGGTALGAIRHKGFIPWDDDLDVFMTFDNYQKFLLVAKNNLNADYYLQEENTKEWPMFFSKLRLNGTTFIEEDTKYRDMHQGFYIDIMCLNKTSKNLFLRKLQFLAARIITAKTVSKKGYITDNKIKKIGMKFFSVIITSRIEKKLTSYIRRFNEKKMDYVGHFFGRAKFPNTSFPIHYLGKPKNVKFETLVLPVPEKVEKYLILRYGEKFMEMPDEKTKSLYPQHAAIVDLNVDYKDFIKNNKI